MRYPRFLLFNSMGALVWSTQAALLGFFAGKAFANQPWIAFAVAFVITILVGGAIGLRERRRIRRERDAARAESARESERVEPEAEAPVASPDGERSA